jgi:hypothetical protein
VAVHKIFKFSIVKKVILLRVSADNSGSFIELCQTSSFFKSPRLRSRLSNVARYGNALPQLCGALFLTDGDIETTRIFHEGGTEFGQEYADFKRQLGHLNVMGRCCGTDHRPIEQIASACLPLFRNATKQSAPTDRIDW